MSSTPKAPNQNTAGNDAPTLLNFDLSNSLADIEKHLAAARHSAAHERIEIQTPPLQMPAAVVVSPPVAPAFTPSNTFESSFLAELAQESAIKQGSNLSATQALIARAQSLHDALQRTIGFFTPFIQFANNMEPEITRLYRLDARTVFSPLKWQGAFLDARKMDLSAEAKWAHVTFSVAYCAPQSVLVTRPWNQLEALKSELNNLKLKVLDESELDSKRPKQEWLQVKLAGDIPVQLKFLADYELGHIDVMARNLLNFGSSRFKLLPEQITTSLLEDLGRILLSRSDRLPDALLPS